VTRKATGKFISVFGTKISSRTQVLQKQAASVWSFPLI